MKSHISFLLSLVLIVAVLPYSSGALANHRSSFGPDIKMVDNVAVETIPPSVNVDDLVGDSLSKLRPPVEKSLSGALAAVGRAAAPPFSAPATSDFRTESATKSMDDRSFSLPIGPIEQAKEAVVVLDNIVNLGQKVFNIVNSGNVSEDISTETANGIPQGAKGAEWNKLTRWKKTVGRIYHVPVVENNKCISVFSFLISYRPGGQYEAKGLYIKNVQIIPTNLNVGYEWFTQRQFSFSAEVKDPVNEGDEENPIASMTIVVSWGLKTHSANLQSFLIDISGDGTISDIGAGTDSGRISVEQCTQ